jgi:predicted HAD superfamily Cof-like phosphohydrolase
MRYEQKQIIEFMKLAQQDTPEHPVMPNAEICKLRLVLIAEELEELAESFGFRMSMNLTETSINPTNLVEAYDAILDLMVVVIGTGVALGLDLEPGWAEVHRSNMSKFIDGFRRADGKWVKGPSYSPANLAPLIEEQKRILN